MIRRPSVAACVFVAFAMSGQAQAQDTGLQPQARTSAGTNLSPAQLDQLVAPVALYPDELLADILTASTYPLEVIDADRWLADPQNAVLSGDELTAALDSRDWDPSVQSLVPFPEVLQLMDMHLDWTEMLGEAFLAQSADVMNAVQRMRQRARSVGNLSSDGEQTVTDQDNTIAISPPADLIYVPQYDPWCAFGGWSDSLSPPFYFGGWSGNCEPAEFGIGFNPGIAWPFPYWGWPYFDWHHHRLLVHPDLYRQFHPGRVLASGLWVYNPQHRGDAVYRNPRNARVFGRTPAQPPNFRSMTNMSSSVISRSARRWDHATLPPLHSAMSRSGGFRPGPGRGAAVMGKAWAGHAPGR